MQRGAVATNESGWWYSENIISVSWYYLQYLMPYITAPEPVDETRCADTTLNCLF